MLFCSVNPAYSELPAFLVKDGGLNSGFMLAHCTAAALVSENKTLCHPASVDSLSTRDFNVVFVFLKLTNAG